MTLGKKIRGLRDELSISQAQLSAQAELSQGYLSQLENGEVKNPSANVLLRVAQAMRIDPDELFEAAGYPTVRTLRQIYQDYEATVDAALLNYLTGLPRDRQRRLLLILQGMEQVLNGADSDSDSVPVPDHLRSDAVAVTKPKVATKASPLSLRPLEGTRAQR